MPQSNGQAERWVREVKRALRKYLVGAAHTKWWHWLGHVRLGLRACVSRSHGFAPFTLLFKQDPALPGLAMPNPAHPLDVDSVLETEG